MKIRTDFVTNSSSSSFICLKLNHADEDIILMQSHITKETMDEAYDMGNDTIELKARMIVDLGECHVNFVGRKLTEEDLNNKTLLQLREELSRDIVEAYGIKINPQDFEFDYGEVCKY